jgi:ABC-type branched-subunit amino acid transport system ATPase component
VSVEAGLEVDRLSVAYGGLRAVDDLTLEAPQGRITGLIGPNGAGKTTTFNACSGLVTPAAGRVRLCGIDVTRHGTAARARAGLGRTFQRMELFTSMTVRDNVALGREAGQAGRNPWRQLRASAEQAAQTAAATSAALELCGIGRLRDRRAGELSTGQRRLVELARVIAGRFRVLLLDEPSSGLDREETEAFGEVLERLVVERRVAVLLVEHDMSLALRICTRLYVLDFGRLLFTGDPRAVRTSEVVRDAYLGSAALEVGGREEVLV